jgi:hypothetical protein
MKKFQLNDFPPRETWLIFRLDTPAVAYIVMELPQGAVISRVSASGKGLARQEEIALFEAAFTKVKYWPKKFIIIEGDPIKKALLHFSKFLRPFDIEPHPASTLENLIAPVRESLGQHNP